MIEEYIDKWKNSGMYIFIAMPAELYNADERAMLAWPHPSHYGAYVLLNFNKDKADGLIAYCGSMGYTISSSINDPQDVLLLTWEAAKVFAQEQQSIEEEV